MLPGQTSMCSPMTGEKPFDGGPRHASPHAPAHGDTRLSQSARKFDRIVSRNHGHACASPLHAIDLVATRRLQSASVLTVTFFVADPCESANNGQCDVPATCKAGDYADCSKHSFFLRREGCMNAPRSPLPIRAPRLPTPHSPFTLHLPLSLLLPLLR